MLWHLKQEHTWMSSPHKCRMLSTQYCWIIIHRNRMPLREGVSYLDNPIVVLLTKCVTNCIKNQATNTTIKRDLYTTNSVSESENEI